MCHNARRQRRHLTRSLSLALSGCPLGLILLAGCASTDYYDTYPYDTGMEVAQPQAAVQTPQQLDQLVAPIALYPDPLVAQILAAATYPAQVVEAQRWMQQNPTLKGDALAKAVDPQPWDASVKALTQVPEVLAMMDQNLPWTSALGEAYLGNGQAVMDAVQTLRQRAQTAGNLKSTPQQNVTTDNGTVAIEPVNPEVVYLPMYDPWLAYGAPIGFWPGWVGYPGLYPVGAGVVFGVGVGLGFYGGYGWGWSNWRPDWRGHGIYYNNTPYRSSSPSFWGHHPGASFGRPPGSVHPGGGYRPGNPAAGYHPGFRPGAGMRSGAFSGFNHGGVTGGFSARGHSSVGGGGFHGGGGAHGGGHR
jgi:hypothetical protein